jgi:predicted membrane protein
MEQSNLPQTQTNDRKHFNRVRKDRDGAFLGILLVVVGSGLILNRMYPEIPDWLISWKTFLIVLGIFLGAKQNFRAGGWVAPIIIGSVFLLIENFPQLSIRPYLWPIAIIVFGLMIIFKNKYKSRFAFGEGNDKDNPQPVNSYDEAGASYSNEDIIESTNIFSGSKKINLSKNFGGGEITNVFGGCELNLTKADFKGRIKLEITNIFGGTKLIVPADWNIQQEAVVILGGIDDKRPVSNIEPNPDKTLVIEGTVMMGGIDIRSY